MDLNNEKETGFLSILKSIKPINNPFKLSISKNFVEEYSNYNFFGFKEDLYNFDIKCPICYGRVSLAKRPNSCFHVFCGPCLKKWAKYKKRCPMCRTDFNKILNVDYSEPWVKQKYS